MKKSGLWKHFRNLVCSFKTISWHVSLVLFRVYCPLLLPRYYLLPIPVFRPIKHITPDEGLEPATLRLKV